MRVDIERVRELVEEFDRLNALPFADIEWYLGGEPFAVCPAVAEDWRFVGMNNTTFVELEFWNEPASEFRLSLVAASAQTQE